MSKGWALARSLSGQGCGVHRGTRAIGLRAGLAVLVLISCGISIRCKDRNSVAGEEVQAKDSVLTAERLLRVMGDTLRCQDLGRRRLSPVTSVLGAGCRRWPAAQVQLCVLSVGSMVLSLSGRGPGIPDSHPSPDGRVSIRVLY